MDIQEITQKITPILRRYNVSRASVFGSVARREDMPGSDVDLMIELGSPIGMIAYSRLGREIEEVLGRAVDLVTSTSVNAHIRPFIERDLVSIYEG